ncbi:hypothetical protein [Gynurincola endophyticus]|uniref:hypothetical protein n=1 Tax=Gynurincola endophyticus TaxID=2479004 RepID=UPI000F8ED7CF|nr:hypothetical protein [Gynurincola endophyticus]
MATGHMTTLLEVLEKLRQRQLDKEFTLKNNKFTIGDSNVFYSPEDLKIIKTYRFEGDSNPDDSSILYLIETKDGIIGYSIDSYGTYSSHDDDDGEYDNFIRNIVIEDREEQLIFDL